MRCMATVTAESPMSDPRLHLLHLSSPALPVGAYAYSQGLEYAEDAGWLAGDGLREWLEDCLQFGVARLDLPILARAMAACANGDTQTLERWNDELLAARETRELLFEDQQLGAALKRLLTSLLPTEPPSLAQAPAYAIMFAVACEAWKLSVDDAMLAYAYSWLENQVAAATKLIPLGQTEAQKTLVVLMTTVPEAVALARRIRDTDIGISLPRLAQASCAHEQQHTRLFRS
jgi:urease accessory protein